MGRAGCGNSRNTQAPAGEGSGAVYAGFAEIYDRLMCDVLYEKWADLLEMMIRRYGVSRPVGAKGGKRDALAEERDLIVDLGCGTGTLTGILADRGYDMMGIDLSPEMLMIAQEKNAVRKRAIPYICQDMRELDLYCTAGTFLSLCDSINYLTKTADLIRVFRLVNRFLFPGGLFLFDFHTKHYYRDVLGTRMIGETGEEISYLWDNTWSEKRNLNRCELTLFARKDTVGQGVSVNGRKKTEDHAAGARYLRVEETHIQRGYLLTEMKQILSRSGLRYLAACDMDTGKRPHAKSERILVAAGENGKRHG
ncbi:MAG: class I SAM-dependent methyltransferase [Lachnospiraceae bacterium]|nr:class I SAM-dependent methyltransferase [Lachnospiraceae bacterium]